MKTILIAFFLFFYFSLPTSSTKICFTWSGPDPSPDHHLYLMNADGTSVARLTSSRFNETYGSWSPDGLQIAFTREELGSGIYVVNADGSGERRLSPIPGFDATPSWSPDGSEVIFSRVLYADAQGVPPTQIMAMRAADGSAARLIVPSDGTFNVEPRWSGESGLIVFMSGRDRSQQLYTVRPDGSQLARVTSQGRNGDPFWSPDGERVSFGSDREGGGKLNVFTMRADGSGVFQVTHFAPPFEAGDTSWSPDGKQIVMEVDIGGEGQSNPNVPASIWIFNADGTGGKDTLQNCSAVGCAPRWQPSADITSAASLLSACLAAVVWIFLFL